MIPTRGGNRVLLTAAALCVLTGWIGAVAVADPPRTLIRNAALVLTMDPESRVGEVGAREHVDILLEGDRIAQIGHALKVRGAQVVDASGKIVLPGFVDTHDHLYQSLIRGCGTDQDLNGWLRACVIPLSRFEFRSGDVYRAVRQRTLDLIGTGVTTVVDWAQVSTPRFAEENVRALTDSGLRFRKFLFP